MPTQQKPTTAQDAVKNLKRPSPPTTQNAPISPHNTLSTAAVQAVGRWAERSEARRAPPSSLPLGHLPKTWTAVSERM